MRERPLLLALETVLRATSLAILAVLFVVLLARGRLVDSVPRSA